MEPISHSDLELATNAYCTCPINLPFEAKKMILETSRKFLTLKYTVKISFTQNNPFYSNIFSNRCKTLCSNKSNSSLAHIRLLPNEQFKTHSTIERKPLQFLPWTMNAFPIRSNHAELSKRIKMNTGPVSWN